MNNFCTLNVFLLLALSPFFVLGEELQPEQELETIIVHPNQEDDWLTGLHGTISDSVYDTALWFDSFFGVEEYDERKLESLVRIRLGWEPRARDFDVFSQKFRLRVKLPNLEERIDLIFTDEESDEVVFNKFNESQTFASDKDDNFTAAVRVINVDKNTRFFDNRIGISGGDVFFKSRLKLTSDFSDVHRFELQPSVFYYLDDGFGHRIFAEYNYNYKEPSQLRINYSVRRSESFNGSRWRHGYYYLNQLDEKQAMVWGLVLDGENNGDDGFFVKNYSVSMRYRINAYRKWLYFEVEPFFEWPEDQDYAFTPGIALRVEGFFRKKS